MNDTLASARADASKSATNASGASTVEPGTDAGEVEEARRDGAQRASLPVADGGVGPVNSTSITVAVSGGTVQGVNEGSTRKFWGIPYAAPPTGTRRFAPPEPVESWQGTRSAASPGPSCPQPLVAQTAVFALNTDEDCLTLNVFAPTRLQRGPAPVIVFIHGGGFSAGGSAAYDGQALSEAGGSIVVSMNYRIGALGFLAHPLLDAALGVSSGNMGLRDQQFALAWVTQNIRTFGGDPNNVTVLGQSAGSMSACLHMFAKGSERLARAFILESGACLGSREGFAPGFAGSPKTKAELVATSDALLDALCGASDAISCLRGLSTDKLVNWRPPEFVDSALGDGLGLLTTGFVPHVDGELIPAKPIELLRVGNFKRAPLIAGTNADEWELFALDLAQPEDVAGFNSAVRTFFTKNVDALIAQQARASWIRLMTDNLIRCPTRALVRAATTQGSPTYLYRFAIPPAAHSLELDYVFGSPSTSWSFLFRAPIPLLSNVVDAMQGYWSTFARSGDPNGRGRRLWPLYTEQQAHLEFAETIDVQGEQARADLDCDFWEGLNPDEYRLAHRTRLPSAAAKGADLAQRSPHPPRTRASKGEAGQS